MRGAGRGPVFQWGGLRGRSQREGSHALPDSYVRRGMMTRSPLRAPRQRRRPSWTHERKEDLRNVFRRQGECRDVNRSGD